MGLRPIPDVLTWLVGLLVGVLSAAALWYSALPVADASVRPSGAGCLDTVAWWRPADRFRLPALDPCPPVEVPQTRRPRP